MTGSSTATFRPWAQAWHDALYGRDGFYRSPEGPAGHFRTAPHASRRGLLGAALARLARLARCTAVLDVGAGRGELLAAVHVADPGLRCAGVDVVDRPAWLPREVGWAAGPEIDAPTLLVGWELLDVVPCPVLEVDAAGRPRVVEVDRVGTERLGPPPALDDLAWCSRWWPLDGAQPGDRVEVGHPREQAWAVRVDALAVHGGLALAVDYGHDLGGRPWSGTLAGYRRGRRVDPVPDGSTDVTAHVALDALAAVRPAGLWLRQDTALRVLGLAAARPPLAGASADPARYLEALAEASEAAELLDPAGLGGFGWVLHPVGEHAARAVSELVRPDSGARR